MDKRDRARRRQLAVRRVVVSAIWAITLFSLTLIIVPAALSGSGFAFGRAARETQRPAASTRPTAGPQETPAAPSETPGAEEEPATSPGAEAGEPETAPEEDAGEAESGPEAFAPVPQSEAVGDEYFKDAVFIGNSRTQGLRLYSGLKDTTWLCSVGLNVETVYTDRFSVNGKELSAVDALAELAPGKLYIMLGLNELGWKSTDLFAEKYGGIIDAALAANPDCVVYVQSILPVSAGQDAAGTWCNNSNVNKFNSRLMLLAEEKGVNYLNVASAVAGEDGRLPGGSTPDGIHLTPNCCVDWLNYLKTHTVTEDEA